ncbi:putative subtilase family protein precursor [Zea mays]|uniref:Subtilisin3 n=1 Tax=Zea mays TaxID=4577 RepID=C0HFN9_MAIZE|nr:putative subtilase family protein precursor [Zea mays]ACN25842.1 unknown [Zea mays]ONM59054.1 subtilisin3 [Zea mays]|eukprot:NP_001159342.1 putative subtilase family protein precursor [Zea mays]
MATTITRLLHHLALFLLIVEFADAVLIPKTKNHAALKPQASSTTYIVHANDLAKPPHFRSLEEWYRSMVITHASSTRAASSSSILYTYDTVMHGFAVQLTGDEARLMSSAPGVIGVYEDRVLYPQTTRSPGFMGLEPGNGAWKQADFGDGVIIGFVDTGIWPESASFDDSGLGPVRSSWRGKCVDAHDFNASLCNNKLVGAKAFITPAADAVEERKSRGVSSPRDKEGHGTHVASTAAGAEVRNASLYMFSRGTARGMAPKARIAMYKACGVGGYCRNADIVAAVDAAVKDGVDIISMSVGGARPTAFHDDVVAIALFGAERKGVFVVLSAGNNGPQATTVINSAPWMTTVGAATVDRQYPAQLTLGNGVVLAGQSLYTMHAKGTHMIQLVSTDVFNRWHSWTPDTVMGKIMVCMHEASDVDGIILQNAGGAGIVDVDPQEWSRDGSVAYAFTLPGLTLSYTAGEKLRAYMASVPYPVASFSFACETVIGRNNRAPVVAGFSSRGPNLVALELLKPDVVAPGVNILAAWSGDASVSGYSDDGRRADYNIISGTSMSCPHVAGIAALIKKKHPSWTPAMVRSALMTTARTVDNRGGYILDNGHSVIVGRRIDNFRVATPLVAGAGHVQPDLALDPGLVYDAGEHDYVHFLCALNYTAEQMRRFVPDFVNCTGTLAGGPASLNYPSFVVAFENCTDVRTLTRTLTKVSEEAETYSVTVVAPEHVKVTVTPTTLEFKEQMETRSYSVEFRNEAGGNPEAGGWDFGQISWENGKHKVRSPVAFHWKN